jgi:hypothetical protein
MDRSGHGITLKRPTAGCGRTDRAPHEIRPRLLFLRACGIAPLPLSASNACADLLGACEAAAGLRCNIIAGGGRT